MKKSQNDSYTVVVGVAILSLGVLLLGFLAEPYAVQFYTAQVRRLLGLLIGMWAGATIYTLITRIVFTHFAHRSLPVIAALYLLIWVGVSTWVADPILSKVYYHLPALPALNGMMAALFWADFEEVRWLFYDIFHHAYMLLGVLATAFAYWLVVRQDDYFPANQSRSSSGHPYTMPTTDPANSRVNRDLIVNLIDDKDLRNRIINMVEAERKAMAPELGIDFGRLARLSYLLNARERNYSARYVLALLIGIAIFAVLMFISQDEAWLGLAVVLSLLPAAVLYFQQRYEVRNKFLPLAYQGKAGSEELEKLLRAAYVLDIPVRQLPSPKQNVVTYSGFLPFVGGGLPLGKWEVMIDSQRPARDGPDQDIPDFTLEDVYSYIERQVEKSGFTAQVSQEVIFVNGLDVRHEPKLLPRVWSVPNLEIREDAAQDVLHKMPHLARRFHWLQVYEWGNDLVVSFILRASLRGKYLVVEANRFVLTPLSSRYRVSEPTTNQGSTLRLMLQSILLGPIFMPFAVTATLFRWMGTLVEIDWSGKKEREKNEAAVKDRTHDYGVQSSLRTSVSTMNYEQYFQGMDHQMIIKVVEKQVIEGIIAFLQAHNIDTSDIRDQQEIILNEGVVVQGGQLKAGSVAVGAAAEATAEQN